MPPSPKRCCTYPGCKVLTTTSRCPAHVALHTGTFADPARGTAKERGYDSHWRKIRAFVLERDQYRCQVAKALGLLEPANEVDHIINKAEWLLIHGSLKGVDHPSNLQAIGHERHKAKTREEAAKARKR